MWQTKTQVCLQQRPRAPPLCHRGWRALPQDEGSCTAQGPELTEVPLPPSLSQLCSSPLSLAAPCPCTRPLASAHTPREEACEARSGRVVPGRFLTPCRALSPYAGALPNPQLSSVPQPAMWARRPQRHRPPRVLTKQRPMNKPDILQRPKARVRLPGSSQCSSAPRWWGDPRETNVSELSFLKPTLG